MLKDLQDVEIVENENAAFICELSCAQAKGEWFKNGEKIKVTSTTKIRQEGIYSYERNLYEYEIIYHTDIWAIICPLL